MKFKMLSANELKPVTAVKYKANDSSRGNEFYYTITAGSRGEQLWEIQVPLSNRNFKYKDNVDSILLDKDDYTLIPIKDKSTRELKKDGNNNTRYFISIDNASFHKKDLALLWEIPNFNYVKVKYKIDGNVKILSIGYIGRERGTFIYRSPVLLLEILGDSTLTYTATNDKGEVFSQTFTYDYNKEMLNVGLVETLEKDINLDIKNIGRYTLIESE